MEILIPEFKEGNFTSEGEKVLLGLLERIVDGSLRLKLLQPFIGDGCAYALSSRNFLYEVNHHD
ncbi:MAG TPA: hypothetical protein VLK33_14910 [Terriglobales bacterium]|nr:hypothetical protein [Terriglobales bacterium]